MKKTLIVASVLIALTGSILYAQGFRCGFCNGTGFIGSKQCAVCEGSGKSSNY